MEEFQAHWLQFLSLAYDKLDMIVSKGVHWRKL